VIATTGMVVSGTEVLLQGLDTVALLTTSVEETAVSPSLDELLTAAVLVLGLV
jgi:hypothetical protein